VSAASMELDASSASNGAAPQAEGGVNDQPAAAATTSSARRAILTNPEALSDPDYSDEDGPPVEEIPPDEGKPVSRSTRARRHAGTADIC